MKEKLTENYDYFFSLKTISKTVCHGDFRIFWIA